MVRNDVSQEWCEGIRNGVRGLVLLTRTHQKLHAFSQFSHFWLKILTIFRSDNAYCATFAQNQAKKRVFQSQCQGIEVWLEGQNARNEANFGQMRRGVGMGSHFWARKSCIPPAEKFKISQNVYYFH